MTCKQIHDQLLDLTASEPLPGSDVAAHLASCATCANELASLRQTMSLLDAWEAPEPSPYFNTRLQARLREEAARGRSWLEWLRKPALALCMLGLLTAGAELYRNGYLNTRQPNEGQKMAVSAPRGTAVADLQDLDKNHDMFANFEVLDDIADATPTPNP